MGIRTKRTLLYIAAAAFIVINTAVFLKGAGSAPAKESPPPAIESAEPAEPAANQEAAEGYIVIAENGYLNLYRTGSRYALERSERINITLFPSGDRQKLMSGVEFESRSEAYEFMENFVE